MKKLLLSRDFAIGIIITFLYLIINLWLINDYGVTWDFTYHFNAGLWHLKHTLTDPHFIMGPSPPLSDIIPSLSYLWVYEKLKVLNWDAAYNLYSVFLGSVGVGIFYFFIKDLINRKVALFSSIILALLPRYFGHLHNNMKDIPQAVMFTLALWMFYRLFTKPNIINLILASLAFGLAYNSKVNAIFVLIIAFVYYLLFNFLNFYQTKRFKISKNVIFYFLFSPLAALIIWWPFWDRPIDRLIEASQTYTSSTINMPILYFGNIVISGNNVPPSYPFGLIAATSPFLVLLLAILGLTVSIRLLRNKERFKYLLLMLWFFIPVSRYFKPHMIVIDDVRHFMELLFPFAVFAGIGADRINQMLQNILKFIVPVNKKIINIFYLLSLIFYLSYQIIFFHPYETSYFSEMVGGIKGAEKRFDIDFWGSSYKQGMEYLNKNAPQNAKIRIAMIPDIAKLYLRKDLIANLNSGNLTYVDPKEYSQSDYTVIMNRKSFFPWYSITNYFLNNKPAMTIEKSGVPLLYIYKN